MFRSWDTSTPSYRCHWGRAKVLGSHFEALGRSLSFSGPCLSLLWDKTVFEVLCSSEFSDDHIAKYHPVKSSQQPNEKGAISIIIQFYRRLNKSSERKSDFSQVAQQVSGLSRIQNQVHQPTPLPLVRWMCQVPAV